MKLLEPEESLDNSGLITSIIILCVFIFLFIVLYVIYHINRNIKIKQQLLEQIQRSEEHTVSGIKKVDYRYKTGTLHIFQKCFAFKHLAVLTSKIMVERSRAP